MTDTPEYTPPKVWVAKPALGRFANINKPTAGAQFERELPIGKHPFQLYSLGTPNGVKVTIMFEELLAKGHKGAEYDAWLIKIGEGDQFGSGFVAINPNSKIPALMDRSGPKPIRVFETAAILMHLAEKFGEFLPTETAARAECLSWLFWQMGSAPYIGGGFGHFYAYAPIKIEYAIDRFTMEAKRLLDVLDRRLGESEWVAGPDYTIADMAMLPVVCRAGASSTSTAAASSSRRRATRTCSAGSTRCWRGRRCGAAAWSTASSGEPPEQLHERHDASDFDTKTRISSPRTRRRRLREDDRGMSPRSSSPAYADNGG